MFYLKRCSLKFRNIHKERPVLESLFNKIAGLKEYCDIFEKTYFEEDLQLAASEGTLKDTWSCNFENLYVKHLQEDLI